MTSRRRRRRRKGHPGKPVTGELEPVSLSGRCAAVALAAPSPRCGTRGPAGAGTQVGLAGVTWGHGSSDVAPAAPAPGQRRRFPGPGGCWPCRPALGPGPPVYGSLVLAPRPRSWGRSLLCPLRSACSAALSKPPTEPRPEVELAPSSRNLQLPKHLRDATSAGFPLMRRRIQVTGS